MEEQDSNQIIRINMIQVSMTLGTWLGLYLILVYALTALSFRFVAIRLLSLPLMLGIPVIAFFLIKNFRDNNCKPFFPFPISWMLTILMFLFATMLSCMSAYLYLRFVDNGALSASMTAWMNSMLMTQESVTSMMTDPAQVEQYNSMMDLLKQSVTWLCSLSPSAMTKQLIQFSLMWGNILSLIIAIITAKRIKLNR